MRPIVIFSVYIQLLIGFHASLAHAGPGICSRFLGGSIVNGVTAKAKAKAIDLILDGMAVAYGLPKYKKQIKTAAATGSYEDDYETFGHMGLHAFEISVRYDKDMLATWATGRPLIVVVNHHLGIVDGLIAQYLSTLARGTRSSLTLIARWIETLLPFAVYDTPAQWGTAIPVEIDEPKDPDHPEYEAKMNAINKFNSRWGRKYLKFLRQDGAVVFLIAGRVAPINAGMAYPAGVRDEPFTWNTSFLEFARMTDADIAFMNVDTVNSESFYENRKRFGGGNKERMIHFLKEAIAKKGEVIDVYLSRPMSLDQHYEALTARHPHSREGLVADSKLTAELMRQALYDLPQSTPQSLDQIDSPTKLVKARTP